MKKIIINESHIRQLVKETLENLILGEEGNNDDTFSIEEVNAILKNATIADVKSWNTPKHDVFGVYLTLNTGIQNCETAMLKLYVTLDIKEGKLTYPGNYYNEPEYEDDELYSFTIHNKMELELYNDEIEKYYSDSILDTEIPNELYSKIYDYIEENWRELI